MTDQGPPDILAAGREPRRGPGSYLWLIAGFVAIVATGWWSTQGRATQLHPYPTFIPPTPAPSAPLTLTYLSYETWASSAPRAAGLCLPIQNQTAVPITISAASLVPPNTAAFRALHGSATVLSDRQTCGVGPTPIPPGGEVVPAGAQATLEVAVRPDCRPAPGAVRASVVLDYQADTEPTKQPPASVTFAALPGNGATLDTNWLGHLIEAACSQPTG